MYLNGMGFTTAQGADMNQYGAQQVGATPGVSGNASVSAGFGGMGGNNGGILTLLAILGGMTVFYFATRKIQGSL